MKLYHGTTATVARKAITEGLLPRFFTGNEGNWKATIESSVDRVYLTSAYAPYFAMAATNENEDLWGIVEIDVDRLSEVFMLPDEDYLEQATRSGDKAFLDNISPKLWMMDTYARTAWFRDRAVRFHHMWKESIKRLGNCAYAGVIPPEAITRIVIYNPSHNKVVTLNMDPTISILNYQFMGEKYEALTRWFIGDPITVDDYLGPTAQSFSVVRKKRFRDALLNRKGWSMIHNQNKGKCYTDCKGHLYGATGYCYPHFMMNQRKTLNDLSEGIPELVEQYDRVVGMMA